MGYDRFLDFIDQAAHVDPGMRYSSGARRKYQKIVTNVIFANQLAAGGTFDDEDPTPCDPTVYIVFLGLFFFIIIILSLVVYALRKNCADYEESESERSDYEESRILSSPMYPVATAPSGSMLVSSPGIITSTIIEADEAASSDAENDEEVAVDTPPAYDSLQPPADTDRAANKPMGGVLSPDESSVVAELRPYPLMLPNNYGSNEPVVVCITHAD